MTEPKPHQRMDELEWLQYKRLQTKKKLDKSRRRMLLTYSALTDPAPVPDGKWDRILYYADRGMSAFQGIRTGYTIASTINAIMSIRHIFKKK